MAMRHFAFYEYLLLIIQNLIIGVIFNFYLLDPGHPSKTVEQQLGAKPRAFEIPTQFP